MRKSFVAGNWKLNGSRAEALALSGAIVEGIAEISSHNLDIVLCPPYVHMLEVLGRIDGSSVLLGGQNCSTRVAGAFTGEISASMLADCGCSFVIVGHSERRQLFGDSNDSVAERFAAVQKAGMTPILCVGESLEERDSGQVQQVISAQVDSVIDRSGISSLENAIIAYEPVWAIGTGKTASAQQAQDVHGWLREKIALLGTDIAANLRIVYGGSVKPSNARELFNQPDIDGGLIGGAALMADEFIGICDAA